MKICKMFVLCLMLCGFGLGAFADHNGCGDELTKDLAPVFVPISSRQFKVACNEHDDCYDTCGIPKEQCDKQFHNRMLGICKKIIILGFKNLFSYNVMVE